MRYGFSLVELLCVIVILAMLASLLFPVFQSAKRIGSVTRANSNMKQIHQAHIIYAMDHGAPPWMIIDYPSNPSPRQLKLPIEVYHTGGLPAYQEDPSGDVFQFSHFQSQEAATNAGWYEHLKVTHNNPKVIADTTHDSRPAWQWEPFDKKRCTAIYFDGHMETRTRPGDPGGFDFWE